MATEVDIRKLDEESKDRSEKLNAILKEINYFNLHDKDEDSETQIIVNNDLIEEKDISNLHQSNSDLIGINFFDGKVDTLYNAELLREQFSNKSNCNLFNSLEITALQKIEFDYQYYERNNLSSKQEAFEYFFQMLFTALEQNQLESISSILTTIIKHTKQTKMLFEIFVKAFPNGLTNLGGNVNAVMQISQTKRNSKSKLDDAFNPFWNIKYSFDVIRFLLSMESLRSCSAVCIKAIEAGLIEDLMMLVLAVFHDPIFVESSIGSDMQCLFGIFLEFFPEEKFSMVVQNFVERLGIFWDASERSFSATTAAHVCFQMFPLTTRGQQMQRATAFYALMCAFELPEVDIVDVLKIYNLAQLVTENVERMKQMSFSSLYDIVMLIEAAIPRLVTSDHEKTDLRRIMHVVDAVLISKSSEKDLCAQTRLKGFIKEAMDEWKRTVGIVEGKYC